MTELETVNHQKYMYMQLHCSYIKRIILLLLINFDKLIGCFMQLSHKRGMFWAEKVCVFVHGEAIAKALCWK